MSKVNVYLADGFEEVEGLTVVDLLRRAGIETDMVSIMGRKEITGARKIPVLADKLFEEQDDPDVIVLPGGMPGTLHLKAHEGLADLSRQGRKIACSNLCSTNHLWRDGTSRRKECNLLSGHGGQAAWCKLAGAAGRCRRKLRDKPGRWDSDCICTHIGYNPEG